jgi:septum formation protein
MPKKPEIILASSSPRRKELLAAMGVSFRVIPSGVDETTKPGMMAAEIVAEVGMRKTIFVAQQFPDCLVIGCDSLVELDGQVYGKPADNQAAFLTLSNLRGKWHQILSGLAVYDPATATYWQQVVTSRVKMRNYTDQEIWEYVATGEPLDKAGSYGIASLGGKLIDRVDGAIENVGGLPVTELKLHLQELGIL